MTSCCLHDCLTAMGVRDAFVGRWNVGAGGCLLLNDGMLSHKLLELPWEGR